MLGLSLVLFLIIVCFTLRVCFLLLHVFAPFFRKGYVESKIRLLVGNLERNPYIKLAHVMPEAYGPINERYVSRASVSGLIGI